MNEFKIVGDYYVSQWNGSSANPGTDVSPFAHPIDAGAVTGQIFVIGSGFYKGLGVANTPKNSFKADGKVIWDFSNTASDFRTVSVSSLIYENIHFKNLGFIGRSTSFGPAMVNCIFENVFSISLQATGTKNCVLLPNDRDYIEVTGTSSTGAYSNSMFFENHYGLNSGMSFNFLTHGKTLQVTALNFTNCLLNGIIRYSSVDYELKNLFDGSTRSDANPLLTDMIDVYPNVYINGNFAGDPKFVDVLNRIVEPNSDLLKLSNTNGYIGGVKPGSAIQKGNTDPEVTITTNQIDSSNPDSWVIDTPTNNEGFIDFTFKISDQIVQIPKIHLDALLAFDGDFAGGTVENNNVPDYFPTNYSPLTNDGLKPNRLTYKLRTSQLSTKPTLDAQWDNDSAILGTTAGVFYDMEFNSTPTINTALGVRYGNADPNGFGGVENTINARWVNVKVRLTNLREI